MAWLWDKWRQIQNKPYQTRIRILWISVGGAAVILLLIWFATIRFRTAESDNAGIFKDLLQIFTSTKEKFSP